MIFGKPGSHGYGVLPDRGDPSLILGAPEEHEARAERALPDRGPSLVLDTPEDGDGYAGRVLPDGGDPTAILPDLRGEVERQRTRRLLRVASVCAAVAVLLVLAAIPLVSRMQVPAEESYAHAVKAHAEGKIPQAIVHLKNVLLKQPENADARYLLARCYLATGQANAAEEELRHAMAYGKRSEEVWPLLGRSMLQTRQYQKLLDEIPAGGAEASPDPAEIYTVRGLAQYALGRTNEATALLEKALAVGKEQPDALLGLARIAAQSGRLNDAGALIDRALAADPRSLDGWMLKVDFEFANRRADGAAEAYRKLLAVYPANIPARLGLASILIDQGAQEAASKYVFAVNREAPHNARANYLNALLAYRYGKLDLARRAVLAALQGAPNDPATQMLAGIVLYAGGTYREAEIPLLRLLEKNPALVGPRKLYAGALMKTGRTTRALEVLIPTLAIAPNDPTLLGLIGGGYLRLGHFAQAVDYLSKAVSTDPGRANTAARGARIGQAWPVPDDFVRALRAAPNETPPEKMLLIAYIQTQQYDRALATIQRFYSESVEDPEVLALKSTILISRKDYAAARRILQTALALDPMHVPSAANLAQVDLAEGDPHNARKRLERIVAKDPRNVNAMAALAALGPALGAKDAEILDWLQQASALRPKSVQLTLMLGEHYQRTGNPAAALALAKDALAEAGDNPDALRMVGTAQLVAGDAAAAVATFSRLLAMQANSPTAMRLLGQAQLANNNYTSAAVLLRKALEISPGDFHALLSLAEAELRAGRLASALTLAREVQKGVPKLAAPYVVEGDVLVQLGDSEGAAKAYERAFAYRRTGQLAIRMHNALYGTGKVREGENVVQAWLDDNPTDVSVRAYYGHFLLQRGRYREAAEEYERILKGDPKNATVLNNLAWSYDQLKDPRAREYAERALQSAPDDPAALDTLAGILLKRGETDRGIALLLRAVTLAPQIPDLRLHLAQGWLKLGDKPKARRELEFLIGSFKDYHRIAEAKSMLAQLNE